MNNLDKVEFILKKLLHQLMLVMILRMMILLNILMIQLQVQEHIKFQLCQQLKNSIHKDKPVHLVFQVKDLLRDLNKLPILAQVNTSRKFKQENSGLKLSNRIKIKIDSQD